MASINGKTEIDTKVNGVIVLNTAKEQTFLPMETSIQVNLISVSLVVSASTVGRTELRMLVASMPE
jgi:hypothetical protein